MFYISCLWLMQRGLCFTFFNFTINNRRAQITGLIVICALKMNLALLNSVF